MLMITRSEEGERGYILKLEGKLLRPWIDELALACSDARIDPKRVNLDLNGLTFVDTEGEQFLRGLLRNGTRVVACSGFVAELLRHPRR
jgi:hypothetical protein